MDADFGTPTLGRRRAVESIMDNDRPIRRYDLREARGFQRLLIARPASALALAALLALAGAAFVFGWVGPAGARSAGPWRIWFMASLCWLFAAYLALCAWRGWRPDEPPEPPAR